MLFLFDIFLKNSYNKNKVILKEKDFEQYKK